ncbi:MAG: UvrD-helicase domain-containing protein, partial [Lachnospiraceae bacterium]|nr:UvrD-helicase domain-containing protein [Lachnospiraceae bacterium]
MTYTDEQLSFINERGCNILVSAAAGSGKTAVIVERVIRLISKDRYSVSELLIVTFTKAAAAEMRDRIRDALSEELINGEPDEETRKHLERQMTLIFSADITTIDSFCLNLVREHFNICRIDPSFRVADEGELKLIAEEVMEELLEKRYESGDKAFYHLVDAIASGRDDQKLSEAISRVYSFAIARPDPMKYISSMKHEYEVENESDLNDTSFMRELLSLSKERIEVAISIFNNALSICDDNLGPFFYRDNLENDLIICRELSVSNTYTELKNALESIQFTRLKGAKKGDEYDKELGEKAKGLRERAKKIIKDEVLKKYFSKSIEDILYELNMCLPDISMLASLAGEYAEMYAAAKQDKGVVDFSDLEHMALEILSDSETRELIRQRYKELIIDEYQDCNRVQEEIFKSISNGHNYVTVGDVKQSIYSFRDACPGLFMDKFESYRSGDKENSKLITLSRNFRSSLPVTETVNGVFSNIMTTRCGGALYDESQRLNYGGQYKGDLRQLNSEYLVVETDPSGNEKEMITEAYAIADRILEMAGSLDIEDRKDNSIRKCGFGDIVILLRSLKGASDTFAEVFAEKGIPLVFDSKSGYLLSYEIKEIINLLTIIDNPRQDIPLAGVMLGYFGGFDATEMTLIRLKATEGDLYDSLKATAEGA